MKTLHFPQLPYSMTDVTADKEPTANSYLTEYHVRNYYTILEMSFKE